MRLCVVFLVGILLLLAWLQFDAFGSQRKQLEGVGLPVASADVNEAVVWQELERRSRESASLRHAAAIAVNWANLSASQCEKQLAGPYGSDSCVAARAMAEWSTAPWPRGKNSSIAHILVVSPVGTLSRTKLERWLRMLRFLSYPHKSLSLAFGVGDKILLSSFEQHRIWLEKEFRRLVVVHTDVPGAGKAPDPRDMKGIERHREDVQLQRRSFLARLRNRLLHAALTDEEFVLWLDADVYFVPPQILTQLVSLGASIAVADCVWQVRPGEYKSYDANTWKHTEDSRRAHAQLKLGALALQGYPGSARTLKLADLRHSGSGATEMDSVGGCALLIQADLHRNGLNFPPYVLGHYVETEGLALMAKRMGYNIKGDPTAIVCHDRCEMLVPPSLKTWLDGNSEVSMTTTTKARPLVSQFGYMPPLVSTTLISEMLAV